MRNVMDGDRRQASLERKLHYIEQEIERQQKARTGVEQLAKVYEEQPDFVDEKGANDVNRQLTEVCMVKGRQENVIVYEKPLYKGYAWGTSYLNLMESLVPFRGHFLLW